MSTEIVITDKHREVAAVIQRRVEEVTTTGLLAQGITNAVEYKWQALDKLLAQRFPDRSEIEARLLGVAKRALTLCEPGSYEHDAIEQAIEEAEGPNAS